MRTRAALQKLRKDDLVDLILNPPAAGAKYVVGYAGWSDKEEVEAYCVDHYSLKEAVDAFADDDDHMDDFGVDRNEIVVGRLQPIATFKGTKEWKQA